MGVWRMENRRSWTSRELKDERPIPEVPRMDEDNIACN